MTDKEKLEAIKAELHRLKEVRGVYKDIFNDIFAFINSLPEEPVSEDLEEVANTLYPYEEMYDVELPYPSTWDANKEKRDAFKAGSQWQKQVFEKNRLAACDRATKEEIEREQDFVDKVLLGEHRQPTFSDAIEYGMRLQKQQTIDKACMYLNEHREGFITDDYIKELRKALEED